MYRSKHQRGYITSHEAKQTHLRTWKSKKKWLYSASVFILTAGNFSGLLLPFTNTSIGGPIQTQAATQTTSQLPNNGSVIAPNVGNNPLTSTSLTQSNWGANISNNASNVTWSNGTLSANLTGTSQYAITPFTPTLNMASPLTFSLPEGNTNPNPTLGYEQGIFFVPAGTTTTQLTSAGAQNGSKLGIGGIPNAVWAGRDYYYDSGSGDYLGNGFESVPIVNTPIGAGTTNSGRQAAIRTTDSSGNLTSATSTTTVDAGNIGSTLGSNTPEIISVVWTPTTVGTSTVTGTLVLTVNGNTVTYTGLVMQRQMQMGLNSSSGTWTSQAFFNVTSGTLSANQTAPVTVNYVTGTGKSLGYTTITANLGDKIGVSNTAPGTTVTDTGNTYDYQAPAIAGYTYSTAAVGVTVTAGGNSLQVNYTANPQTVYWNYGHAFTSDGSPTTPPYPAVPSPQVGTTGATITAPTLPAAPAGWSYAGVRYNSTYYFVNGAGGTTGFPNGTSGTYANITAAMTAAISAAGNAMGATSIGTGGQTGSQPANDNANNGQGGVAANNSFMIMLQANAQTASFNYGYVSTAQNTPTAPTVMTAAGVTGATVTAPTGYNTVSTATTSNKIPFGYYISAIYPGTSATGTALVTGTAAAPAVFPTSGQTYGASGSSYYLQLTPFTVQSKLTIAVAGADPLGVDTSTSNAAGTVRSTVGSATPTSLPATAIGVLNGSLGTSFTSSDNVNYIDSGTGDHYVVTGFTLNGKTYPTMAALIAANPTVPAAANNAIAQAITMNMVYDGTKIISNPNSNATAGSEYKPATDITQGLDMDGADDDGNPALINGYDVVANIVSQDGTVNYWGDATNTINLAQGTYTETFYALNYLGLQAYQAQTTYSNVTDYIKNLSSANLQNYTVNSQTNLSAVKPFELPFTGGEGTAGIVGLALMTGGTGLILKRRRKNEEKVEGGNKDEKNKK